MIAKMKILILHGPNLNMLGAREPEIYGHITLDALNIQLHLHASTQGADLVHLQSNQEHVLIEAVQKAPQQGVDFIIINPAAFAHTSIALRDAFLAVKLPFIEVHLSNIFARETFRQHSYLADIANGVISGLGAQSYFAALDAALRFTKT